MTELTLKKEINVNAPAEKVWEVITTRDLMHKWMLVPATISDEVLREGSTIEWKYEDGTVYLTGTVVGFEPGEKLLINLNDISWDVSVPEGAVTYSFELNEKDGETHVDYRLGDLAVDAEGQQWYDAYDKGHELEDIKQLAEGNNAT